MEPASLRCCTVPYCHASKYHASGFAAVDSLACGNGSVSAGRVL